VTEKFELCVNTETKNLEAIASFVTSIAGELELDDDVSFALQMAVDEACANVMEHAYDGQTNGKVHITCQTVGDEVVVRIHDHGRPFDPQSVTRLDPDAPLEKRGEGALGLYLMEKLMDSVEFHFDPTNGNTLTMKKRIHRGKQAI
jgi:serine/threonine-protein kinase RsbW